MAYILFSDWYDYDDMHHCAYPPILDNTMTPEYIDGNMVVIATEEEADCIVRTLTDLSLTRRLLYHLSYSGRGDTEKAQRHRYH